MDQMRKTILKKAFNLIDKNVSNGVSYLLDLPKDPFY